MKTVLKKCCQYGKLKSLKVEGVLHGTGIICKLSKTAEFLFIITAKHNVCGSEFRDTPTVKNVRLSFLWDVQSTPPQYRTYSLRPTDQILCSESNDEDLCVIIVNRLVIESLIGELPTIRLTNNPDIFGSVIFRGFPDAYCLENIGRQYAQKTSLK